MKHTVALLVSLVLLVLGSPLLSPGDFASADSEGLAVPDSTGIFMEQEVQSEPLACSTLTLPIDFSMTKRECIEVCGGCYVCEQGINNKCIDCQCC